MAMKLLFVVLSFLRLGAAAEVVARRLYDAENRVEYARLYGGLGVLHYYFMDLLVGSPVPQRVSVIADTGSSLAAFPCSTCTDCGIHIDNHFDVTNSTTFRWTPCSDCPGRCVRGRCTYEMKYIEQSTVHGYYFSDMVRIGNALQENPPVRAQLGCHFKETHLFVKQRANGILGLATRKGGKNSILHHLYADKKHINHDVFAMCLATDGGLFAVGGTNETMHTGPVQWIPMTRGSNYNLKVDHITFSDHSGRLEGNFGLTYIDSGTSYTYFPPNHYSVLMQMFEKSGIHLDEEGCTENSLENFPILTFQLRNRRGRPIKMQWNPRSYMLKKRFKFCRAFAKNEVGGRGMAELVLGASWMKHMDVIFDVPRQRIGIAPADCPSFAYSERPPPVWFSPPPSPSPVLRGTSDAIKLALRTKRRQFLAIKNG